MQCSNGLGDKQRATQIQATLERRYSADTHPRVRYYLEISRGNTPVTARDEGAQDSAPDNWDDFLSVNGLAAEEGSPEPLREPESAISAPIIAEEEVSLSSLKALFDAAWVENALEGDDLLRVVPDGATRVIVTINEANKLLHFSALYGLRKFAPEDTKRKLANRLNAELIFVRFAVHDATTFVADAHLPYSGGLFPQQVIQTVRLLARIASPSIEKFDEDDCVS